jgi:diguanylate cyclase (GGDEF)-like protein
MEEGRQEGLKTNDPGEVDDRLPLYRRGVLDRDLPAHIATAVQSKEPLALVMVDVDRFKPINDQHGHLVGDEILEFVATTIKLCTGAKGTCYRYGGDEMCLVLPNHTSDEALALAERIRKQVENAAAGTLRLKVTASFGVAEYPTHAATTYELLKMADDALYEAKELGRNYVRVSGEPKPAATAPQVVARREPEPGGLTEKQMERIRMDYFRNGAASCPKDGVWLTVKKIHPAGRKTPDLYVLCPICGLDLDLPGPN